MTTTSRSDPPMPDNSTAEVTGETTQVRKRAIDVTPYEHAIWCTVGDSKPYANTIVSRRWSEDGAKIWFMLDSHNFLSAAPDEEIDVVENETGFYNAAFQADRLRRDAETMRDRPAAARAREGE